MDLRRAERRRPRRGHAMSTDTIIVHGIPAPRDPKTGRLISKHGWFGTPEYQAWRSMLKRCGNPSDASYQRYGARGITVCDRWRESFQNFIDDMGPKPTAEHSLDRKNNDGPYDPGNCQWATRSQQQSNRCSVRFLEFNGERIPLAHWSKRTGISRSTLLQRINAGWTHERALTTPPDKRRASK